MSLRRSPLLPPPRGLISWIKSSNIWAILIYTFHNKHWVSVYAKHSIKSWLLILLSHYPPTSWLLCNISSWVLKSCILSQDQSFINGLQALFLKAPPSSPQSTFFQLSANSIIPIATTPRSLEDYFLTDIVRNSFFFLTFWIIDSVTCYAQ